MDDLHARQIESAEEGVGRAVSVVLARRFGPRSSAESGITTDYAMLVEILCNSEETRVRAVHYYVVQSDGQIAHTHISNSHFDDFNEVDPRDRSGGYAVLLRMLESEWRRSPGPVGITP